MIRLREYLRGNHYLGKSQTTLSRRDKLLVEGLYPLYAPQCQLGVRPNVGTNGVIIGILVAN